MIGALGLPWVRAAGVALLVVSAGVGGLVLAHQRDAALGEAADARTALAQERAQRQQAIADALALVRVREQHLADRLQHIQDRHDVQIADARAAAGHAAAAADRLRVALDAAGGSIRRAASAYPGSAGDSTSAAADSRVLPDVLGECVERVRALAAAADAGRAAGEQCATRYDALTAHQ